MSSREQLRTPVLNVAIHKEDCSKSVWLQHPLMDITGALIESLSYFAVEILFTVQRHQDLGNEEAHIEISQGIIGPVEDKIEFEAAHMSFPNRKYIISPFCTLGELQRESAPYRIRFECKEACTVWEDTVYSEYQVIKAYGCKHCVTGCELKCSECGGLFCCLECHAVEGVHTMDCKTIESLQCLRCEFDQPFDRSCEKCGLEFGNYHCGFCKLNIYISPHEIPFSHCNLCESCHEADLDMMKHCERCRRCYRVDRNHICRIGECSVCLGSAEFGPEPYNTRCSHLLHVNCAHKMIEQSNYKCPLCRRIFLNNEDERKVFKQMVSRHKSYFVDHQANGELLQLKCFDCQTLFCRIEHPSDMYFCKCGSFNTEIECAMLACEDEDVEGPVKYEYLEYVSICRFLVKKHEMEVELEYGIDSEDYTQTIKHIFRSLEISGSPIDCMLIGLIYNEAIETLRELREQLQLIMGIMSELAEEK